MAKILLFKGIQQPQTGIMTTAYKIIFDEGNLQNEKLCAQQYMTFNPIWSIWFLVYDKTNPGMG